MKFIKIIKDWANAIRTARRNQKKTVLDLRIEEAEQKHRETGKRYHVVEDSANNLIVVDNTIIDYYNRKVKKIGGKKITIVDLLQMTKFSTK